MKFFLTLFAGIALIAPAAFGNDCGGDLAVSEAPVHGTVAYATHFILTPKDPSKNPVQELIPEIYQWAYSKFRQNMETVTEQTFSDGIQWSQGGFQLSTSQLKHRDGNAWALGLLHPDSSQPARRWRVDIGITQIGRSAHLRMSVSHWIDDVYLGQRVPRATSGVPRMVNGLFSPSSRFHIYFGKAKLMNEAVSLKAHQTPLFQSLVEDPTRVLPVVFISRTASGEVHVNPAEIAQKLRTTAFVLVAEDAVASFENLAKFSSDTIAGDGGITLFLPGQRTIAFPVNTVVEQGWRIADTLYEAILRANMRPHGLFPSIRNLTDLKGLQTDAEIEKLKKISAVPKEVTVKEVEVVKKVEVVREVIKEVIKEVRVQDDKLQKELETAEGMMTLYEDENASLRKDNDVHKQQVAELKAKVEALQSKIDAETKKALVASIVDMKGQTARKKRHFETNMDAVSQIQETFSDRVVFTDKAIRSAKSADFKHPDKTHEALTYIATTLYDLYFNEKVPPTKIPAVFQARTGFEFAPTESSYTKQTTNLRKLREDVYRGKVISADAHLKYGNKTKGYLRIHVYVSSEDRRLVISHVGDHLENAMTRIQ